MGESSRRNTGRRQSGWRVPRATWYAERGDEHASSSSSWAVTTATLNGDGMGVEQETCGSGQLED